MSSIIIRLTLSGRLAVRITRGVLSDVSVMELYTHEMLQYDSRYNFGNGLIIKV